MRAKIIFEEDWGYAEAKNNESLEHSTPMAACEGELEDLLFLSVN